MNQKWNTELLQGYLPIKRKEVVKSYENDVIQRISLWNVWKAPALEN